MPVIREYRCCDCGHAFESMDAQEDASCPVCTSSEAEREFRTAPGIKSPDTSFTDNTVKTLAADYGLSDVSNKDGRAVRSAPSGPHAPQFSNDQRVMGQLARLGNAADNASPVLPMLRAVGGPRNWQKRQERR